MTLNNSNFVTNHREVRWNDLLQSLLSLNSSLYFLLIVVWGSLRINGSLMNLVDSRGFNRKLSYTIPQCMQPLAYGTWVLIAKNNIIRCKQSQQKLYTVLKFRVPQVHGLLRTETWFDLTPHRFANSVLKFAQNPAQGRIKRGVSTTPWCRSTLLDDQGNSLLLLL